MDRNNQIIHTSVISILTNLVLVFVKFIIGTITGSLAIILDAVNNLGDALSSIITIVGTKLAGKRPDKKHPFGYGRVEYLTSIVIAVIVMTAGLTSLKESAIAIFHPEPATYTAVSLVIIAIGVVVKLLSGSYIKSVGVKLNANSLIASGSEALGDAILSATTFLAALVSIFFHISLESYLGLVISCIIIKAGLEIFLETLASIIGERADAELTQSIKAFIREFEGVNGAYDLILHNYGPTKHIGSVHVEVADSFTAKDIHRLTYQIMDAVYQKYNIVLTVGIYAANTESDYILEMKNQIASLIEKEPEIIQMHGFYADKVSKKASFDIVINFKVDHVQVVEKLKEQCKQCYPDFAFRISVDTDFSD